LRNDTSITQNHKIWNRLNLEPGGQLRMLLCIHLQNQSPTRSLPRKFSNLGCGHLAWPTPGRPEINKYRNTGLADYIGKGSLIHINRFADWRKRRFARTAPTGIGKVAGRHAVLSAAGFTDTDHRKTHGPSCFHDIPSGRYESWSDPDSAHRWRAQKSTADVNWRVLDRLEKLMNYRFGVFEFDADSGNLRKNGRPVALEPQRGKGVSRDHSDSSCAIPNWRKWLR
jgi:hypothetical protein